VFPGRVLSPGNTVFPRAGQNGCDEWAQRGRRDKIRALPRAGLAARVTAGFESTAKFWVFGDDAEQSCKAHSLS
jgi:hypothetical protein